MLSSISKEIILRKNYLTNQKISSIYFGGGTPSVLDAKEIKSLLKTIFNYYKTAPAVEITL